MKDVYLVATELAAMQPEELALVYEAWDEIRFNKKVQHIMEVYEELDLSKAEAEKLINRFKKITWVEENKQQKGDKK